MYYCNKECKILSELENEVVIELLTGLESYYDEYEQYQEPVYQRIIVDKKYITEKEVNIDEMFKEIEVAKISLSKELSIMKQNSNKEIREEKQLLEQNLKELKIKSSKFKGLEIMYEYLNDEIKYVFFIDNTYNWRAGIIPFKDLHYGKDETELSAVSFRHLPTIKNRQTDIQMYISQYTDDSGSKYRVIGFKTLLEAIEYLKEYVEKDDVKITDHLVKECKVYNITSEKVNNYVKERDILAVNRKQKEIEQLEIKIKVLKNA